MDTNSFPNITRLATALSVPIAVYDLEATTFRGRENFGITEVAVAVFRPDGSQTLFGSLIDPERPIDASVQALTGITPSMVRGKETWGARYAALFYRLAAGQAWVCGYNNQTFDNHAVMDMGARYGTPITEFARTFDVRSLYRKLTGIKHQKGTLSEVAAAYGVQLPDNLHRAAADVFLTAQLLEALLRAHGHDAVVRLLIEKPTGARDQLHVRAIAAFIAKKKGPVSLEQLATAFKAPTQAVQYEVGRALDERLVSPDKVVHEEAQLWLRDQLPTLPEALLHGGRLRPVMEALSAQAVSPPFVDYVQLRIALLALNVRWASLSPA